MYVFEEMYQGRKLHELINETHENPKYLPGIRIPDNIVATPDIREAVRGAHVLVFVMPHQFIKSLCQEIQGHVLPGAKAISLVKGFDCEHNQINLSEAHSDSGTQRATDAGVVRRRWSAGRGSPSLHCADDADPSTSHLADD
jgi:glycerol-3-phosphate dehydrogenase